MKVSLSLIFSFSLLWAVWGINFSVAQGVYHPMGDQFGPQGFQAMSGDLIDGRSGGYGGRARSDGYAGFPGRVWFRSNFADRGLGYRGNYFTLGSKTRLFEDRFDGRWLMEAELHHSLETGGGFFSNVGLERVFSIDAANADVSASVWYDYDNDREANFSHKFNQIGASLQLKTPGWDLIGNGYFPVGTTDYAFGDPNGLIPFAENRIVVVPGINSALQGFDVTMRFRPAVLSFVNGTFDVGGYHYESDLVDSFAGGRLRLGIQTLRGMIMSGEINHDERFNTTGVASVGWLFGANASGRGHEYSRLGRDLDSIARNDHIVRFNQDAQVLINPLTGLPYNVIFVDNNSDPFAENGTFENPFSELQTAQANSNPADVIAVLQGDGTDRNLDQGIVLQDNQRLWGLGLPLLVPSADGTLFQLPGLGDDRPIISNNGGFSVVQMANNNEVAGVEIDGTGATFGIFGNGDNGIIRENVVRNAGDSGARIANASGDWLFQNNLFELNGGSGLHVLNYNDPTGRLMFDGNQANLNGLDGIQLQNIAPASLVLRDNTTNGNARHGLHLINYVDNASDPVLIHGHNASQNLGRGIMIDGGEGSLRIVNSNLTNNIQAGLTVLNWNNSLPGQSIFVGNENGEISDFSGNGALGNIEFLLTNSGTINNLLVTGIQSDDGVRGFFGRAEGENTIFNVDLIDNESFNNNVNDGIRLLAIDGATVNTRIASTSDNPNFRQQIIGNALGGGSGIALFAEGAGGLDPARINASIENVNINNRFNDIIVGDPVIISIPTTGIEINSLNNAVVDVDIRNSQIGIPNANRPPGLDTSVGISALFANDGNNLINRLNMDELTLFNNIGVTVFADQQTLSDISLTNSTIRPNGPQSSGIRQDNNPFTTSAAFLNGTGTSGVLISANGQTIGSGDINRFDRPDIDPLYLAGFEEQITDGIFDNLTRINIANNDIQDFAENGIEINSFGDAQVLATIIGNNVRNNGAGYDNDPDNINVYLGNPGAGINPNELLFFDGIRLHAYDQSTFSAIVAGNTIVDNFERGLRLNTFNRAVMNVSVNNNVMFGNDRGEDQNNTVPDFGTGVFASNAPLADSAIFSMEAINNAEFYIRPHESPILLNGAGNPIDLFGVELPADTLGVFFPGNTGFDIFGFPVAVGAAQLHLSMSSNSLQLNPDLQNFAQVPGIFTLGLDGATNGFTGPFFGLTPVALNFADALIQNEINFFNLNGF